MSVNILTSSCKSAIKLLCKDGVDEKSLYALLDSGADVNCVSSKFIIQNNIPLETSNIIVVPLGGKSVKNKGMVTLNVSIKGVDVPLQFVVLEQIGDYDLILGLPAFEQCDI